MTKWLGTLAALGALGMGTTALAARQGGDVTPLTGVVTRIDKGSQSVTMVLPAAEEVDVTHIGRSVFLDKQVNLVSIQAKVDQRSPIFLDGKKATFSDLREGDVLRTSYDPAHSTIHSVSAISQKYIDADIGQARSELKRWDAGNARP